VLDVKRGLWWLYTKGSVEMQAAGRRVALHFSLLAPVSKDPMRGIKALEQCFCTFDVINAMLTHRCRLNFHSHSPRALSFYRCINLAAALIQLSPFVGRLDCRRGLCLPAWLFPSLSWICRKSLCPGLTFMCKHSLYTSWHAAPSFHLGDFFTASCASC
jgi:hypothetical protein